MKILYITTIGGTMNFFKTFIKELVDEGHTVDMACNDSVSKPADMYTEIGCRVYSISTSRSPYSKGNLIAIKQIRKLVEENGYDIVHCHTPIAAMCTRLACRKLRKKGIKVIYTAHGFHFYKGAPVKNWLLYYPIEKICAHWTDTLININLEDYTFSKEKMKAKRVEYVPGVGVDTSRFDTISASREEKRDELQIPQDATVVMSVGELNTNKNHEAIIRAVAKIPGIYYMIAGKGLLKDYLQNLIDELGISDRVKLVGFRRDIGELLNCADIFAFPSYREGLPVSVMEAMYLGLPVVASDIRGVRDLIEDGKNGFLCNPSDANSFSEKLKLLSENKGLCVDMGIVNKEKADDFNMKKVNTMLWKIYGLDQEKNLINL